MTLSIWTRRAAAPAEDDLNAGHSDHDVDFVGVDIDHVPTLYDVYEQTFVLEPDGIHDDERQQAGIPSELDDLPEVQALYSAFAVDVDPAAPVQVEEPAAAYRADNESALVDPHGKSSQAPMHSMEEVFNRVRRDPLLLQRSLLGVACLFQIIAAAALWRAVGDKVVATELVPSLVYASIGVAAYLLGRRYLRIHFAQVRVGDKDWLRCEQVMVAADNGVMLKARFGTAYLIWEQLLGVAQDDDYYYLLIERNQGFKVPKQGVSDPELKIKFEDLASLTRARALQG